MFGAFALASAVLVAACGGRTPLDPPECALSVTPSATDFGEITSGQSASRTITLTNTGLARCDLRNLGLTQDSDSWFSLDSGPASEMVIDPGQVVGVRVTFHPGSPAVPLRRTAELSVDVVSDPAARASAALTGTVHSDCVLDIVPVAVDFGLVKLGQTATKEVVLANRGTTECVVDQVVFGGGTDAQFRLPRAGGGPLRIAPGAATTIAVAFAAADRKPPRHRTGMLDFGTIDPEHATVSIPLSADIDVGCDLAWAPAKVDFGSVILNNTVSADLTLTNGGTESCEVADMKLSDGSDRAFAIAPGQATSFQLPRGESRTVKVTFIAADSNPPYAHTGTLVFGYRSSGQQRAEVPLSATVSTVCISEASRWIYTWDSDGILARFDPSTLAFKSIALVDCGEVLPTPFSMAVDQDSNAWVLYGDGDLHKVDTKTGACEPTRFVRSQHNITVFGMGFVFDPKTGTDTLYIAGGVGVISTHSTLATVSFPSLTVNPIGTVTAGTPELAGTGDGELWGFVPQNASSNGHAVLVRIDPKTGATLETHSYSLLDGEGGAWAMKFWGGDFWIFLGTKVYKVARSAPDRITEVIADTRRAEIVGAGVSSCAPLH
jgi:streptogramin lyase